MDEYFASGGSLKLKGVSDGRIKKKKKKSKEKKLDANIIRDTDLENSNAPIEVKSTRTQAEVKFEQRRLEKERDRILKKACKTHKEKVEEFNSHLDNLTEHFDIPKVSWTK